MPWTQYTTTARVAPPETDTTSANLLREYLRLAHERLNQDLIRSLYPHSGWDVSVDTPTKKEVEKRVGYCKFAVWQEKNSL